MQLEKVKDPKTGSVVEMKDGKFPLSEGTISHEEAVEKFNNGEIVGYLGENAEEDHDYKTLEINLDESVSKVLSEETDISEETKNKMSTLFESAVNERVNQETARIQEEYEQKLEEKENELIENVDDYLSYAVREWKKENQIALEEGAKAELTSNLVNDLRKVFENHNIDLPEEKVDKIEELNSRIESLQSKLDEQYEENKKLQNQISESEKEDIIEEVGSDLASTQFERFKSLVEDLDFTSNERFKQKAQTILETHFRNDNSNSSKDTLKEEGGVSSQNSPGGSAQPASLAEQAARLFGNE